MMRGFALDCRMVARSLQKARGFSGVVIITLALGTGASAAMFSVLRASLFRPPPFPEPERLVMLSLTDREPGHPFRQAALSNQAYDFVREHATSFESIAAYTTPHLNVTGYDQPERIEGEVVSANYFHVLGVSAVAGRGFVAEEDSVPGGAPVVVLSHALWQRRFGTDPTVLGKQLSVNRIPLQVVGIMPPGFRGLSGRADLWIPRAMAASVVFPYRSYNVVARLRPNRTLEEARSELQVLGARLAQGFPEAYPSVVERVATAAGERSATATPLDQARIDLANRTPVVILFCAVGVLLLIACANTANLFLVRTGSREREVAVRLAVGSSRWRLIRLLLTESLLLAILGGAAGLGLASLAIGTLSSVIPPRPVAAGPFGSVGDFSTPRLDFAIVGFAWVVVALTAILFGLAPAIRAAKTELVEALKTGGRSSAAARWRAMGVDLYGALTVGEIALAVVLLAGSGLLLRSLRRLETLPLGFDTQQLTTFQVQAQGPWYAASEAPVLVERLVDRVSSVPGVSVAAGTYYTPFDPGAAHTVHPAGTPGGGQLVGHHRVTPDYFRALRIPILRGRAFTPADRVGRPLVAVVSASAAQRLWPGEDPVGKRFFFGTGMSEPADSAVEVVGLVGDVRYRPGRYRAEPDLYTPYYQFPSMVWALLIVRSEIPSARLVPALREAVVSVDPNLPIAEVQTMEERSGNQLARRRLNAVLLSIFAGLALAIATVGVYGVISHQSAQRTREFGIRIAVGAAAQDVLRHVLVRAVALIAAGLALGVLGALVLTRVLRSQLFEIGPTDPGTFAVIAGILAVAALVASYLPARQATKVEPLTALRTE